MPVSTTDGLEMEVLRSSKRDSAATDVEKWIVCGDETLCPAVFVCMFIRRRCAGFPMTVISMAVLIAPLPVQLQFEKYASVSISSSPLLTEN